MKRAWALCLALLLAASGAWAQSGYPALFAVAGVAGDDVLNIRRGPSGDADIIGSFGPFQTGIEVTGADSTGKWLRVNTQEQTGWAAARFLERSEEGDYAFARGLNCFGAEPFWSLDMIQGTRTTLSLLGAAPKVYGAGLVSRGEGRPDRYIVGFGDGLVVLSQRSCSDGMSDLTFGLEASVVVVDQGLTLYSGCCSIQPD